MPHFSDATGFEIRSSTFNDIAGHQNVKNNTTNHNQSNCNNRTTHNVTNSHNNHHQDSSYYNIDNANLGWGTLNVHSGSGVFIANSGSGGVLSNTGNGTFNNVAGSMFNNSSPNLHTAMRPAPSWRPASDTAAQYQPPAAGAMRRMQPVSSLPEYESRDSYYSSYGTPSYDNAYMQHGQHENLARNPYPGPFHEEPYSDNNRRQRGQFGYVKPIYYRDFHPNDDEDDYTNRRQYNVSDSSDQRYGGSAMRSSWNPSLYDYGEAPFGISRDAARSRGQTSYNTEYRRGDAAEESSDEESFYDAESDVHGNTR